MSIVSEDNKIDAFGQKNRIMPQAQNPSQNNYHSIQALNASNLPDLLICACEERTKYSFMTSCCGH